MAGEARQAIDVISKIPNPSARFEELQELAALAQIDLINETLNEFRGKKSFRALAAEELGTTPQTISDRRRRDPRLIRKSPKQA
jgi:hypothetical protein